MSSYHSTIATTMQLVLELLSAHFPRVQFFQYSPLLFYPLLLITGVNALPIGAIPIITHACTSTGTSTMQNLEYTKAFLGQ
ncbi:hypothetical protein J3R30DRAFT_3501711 [Lentinula aciculospora]|uniref:Uncharacterized protein n=1 Tax=Lentinula aciculospora TaxID=153920 RepID=A0A9W9A7S5_9AGAR|nr:hypothetical protein J3R30DRAFT_3501711 [Lentinula aciculospora]